MSSIGSVAKAALFEAYAAAVQLLPFDLRGDFVLIGGTSMLVLGGDRKTDDVDIVATPESLNAFEEAAATDARFAQDAVSTWYYACTAPDTTGILVQLEFLAMGGGHAPMIRAARPALGGFRAGLGELALMKAITLDSRGEQKDIRDLRFVLEKMEESDESFASVEMEAEDLEILKAGVAELGGRYPVLLESLLRRGATR